MLIHEWADQAATRRPDARAVVARSDALSYGELSLLSGRIARMLVNSGCVPGSRVCLLMPKSPMAIAAILGIYKAGCIYVPLDPANPAARLAKIVLNCACHCILATTATATRLHALLELAAPEGGITIGWLDHESLQRKLQQRDFVLADVLASSPLSPLSAGADTAAHILFTSGSTGEPKGVVITHANVVAFVQWAVAHFGISADERLSAHSPLHFDLSMFDIFGAQAAGAELHIPDGEQALLPHKLAQWVRDSRLTQWFSVPALLNYLCRFDAVAMQDFPELRRVLWCGEVLPTPTLQYWMQRLPHVQFTNLYGPTEATIASSYYTLSRCPTDARAAIPIGRACPGEQLLVLDERLRPLPVGQEGDLYIGGVGLAQGYWQDPARTDAAFVSRTNADGKVERLYRTGDRARLDLDDLVYFHGRCDQQIKSRGYRIELGEIEAALHTLACVSDAAVVAVPDEGFANFILCCAYVNAAGIAATPVKLRTDLAALLPPYMLPSRWLAVSHLPRNANGKVDRNRLKELFNDNATPARKQA